MFKLISDKLMSPSWQQKQVLFKIITFMLIMVLLLFDQIIKLVVQKKLQMGTEYQFLPGFISFKYVINYGSAFGLNQNRTVILIVSAFIVATILFVWWGFTVSRTNILGLSFIIAGVLGNLFDRFLHNGGVVDFLKWDLFPPTTIFNMADTFITIGAIIIVISLIFMTWHSFMNERSVPKKKKDK